MSAIKESAGLYLGYDASCLKCSTIANRIEGEVDSQLTLLPLSSPLMRRWREELLGEEARWAPTLVRISGEKRTAYIGWQMGPQLASALGAKRSFRVLSALGGEQLAESSNQQRAPLRSISRKMFLRSSAALAGMVALMGVSKSAIADPGAPDASNESVTVDDISTLSESEMVEELQLHLASSDISNVVSSSSLGARASQATALTEIPSNSFVRATGNTGEAAPDEDVSEVQATRVVYSSGVTESAVAIYNHQSQTMIVSRQMDKPIDGVTSIVRRLNVSSERLSAVAQSINGSSPSAIEVEDVSTLSGDPCSGCAGAPGDRTRKRLQDVCNWDLTISCARDAGLCLGCIPASVGSVVAVVLCIGAQCGWSTLDTCCSSMDSACVGCGGQT